MSDKCGTKNKSDGKTCYGTSTEKKATIFMSGGCAEWWDYVFSYDKDDNQTIYISDRNGLHKQHNLNLVFCSEDEQIVEYTDDEIKELELPEGQYFIDKDFFDWGDN